MPFGFPDFYAYRQDSSRTFLSDLAELAARIASYYSIDRSGSVIFSDNFSNGLAPYEYTQSGGNITVRIDSNSSYSGLYCALLKPDNANSSQISISKTFYTHQLTRSGFEGMLATTEKPTFTYIRMEQNISGNNYTGTIRLDYDNLDLHVFDGSLGYQKVSDIPEPENFFSSYIPFKLLCDFDLGLYVSIRYGKDVYDISTFELSASVSPKNDLNVFSINVNGRNSVFSNLYVDNIVITNEE